MLDISVLCLQDKLQLYTLNKLELYMVIAVHHAYLNEALKQLILEDKPPSIKDNNGLRDNYVVWAVSCLLNYVVWP